MKSKLQCTTHHAIGAVVEVANGMFNCQLKYHNEDKETYDLNYGGLRVLTQGSMFSWHVISWHEVEVVMTGM